MGNIKCIYCGTEDNLTKSDIIPSGLTNKKLVNSNVCCLHNQKINLEAESYVINELKFLRNNLGITTREGKPITFDAVIEIEDKSFPTRISTKKKFYKKDVTSASLDGINHVIGPINELNKLNFKNKAGITVIDTSLIYMNTTILNTNLLISEQMLRMVAKITFEWYCKQNSINDVLMSFKHIIEYIVDGIKPNYNLVEIVTDLNLYKQLKDCLFLGSHTFSITYQRNGDVYVLYSFFGLVIYKVKISSKYPITLLKDTRTNFYGFSLDGNEQVVNTPTIITPFINSKDANSALKLINELLTENLHILLTTHLVTIKSLATHVINIEKAILKLNPACSIDEIYYHLVSLQEDREITALFILEQLGEQSDIYDEKNNFNYNLMKILNTNDYVNLNSEQIYKQLEESNQKGELIEFVAKGISLYKRAFKNEVSFQKKI